jgi:uncharacterized protein with HEPN domain
MQPDVKKFLFDVQTAGMALQEFLEGKTFADYVDSDFLRSAVERKLMIIGEAVGRIIRIDPELEQKLQQARKVVDFRNILVHGYSAIENETVWGILQKDLPVLNRQVTDLLRQ